MYRIVNIKEAVYTDPLAAYIHSWGFTRPNNQLWHFDGDVAYRVLTPKIPVIKLQIFAIKCALHVCQDPIFVAWANAWLSGVNREREKVFEVYNELNMPVSVSRIPRPKDLEAALEALTSIRARPEVEIIMHVSHTIKCVSEIIELDYYKLLREVIDDDEII